MGFLANLFGSKSSRDMKEIRPLLDKTLALEDDCRKMDVDALRHKTVEFKERIHNGVAEEEKEIKSLKELVEKNPDMDLDKMNDIYDEIDKKEEKVLKKIDGILEEILPEAFAIVKETARRFKENEVVEATATDLDRDLSLKFENIRIEGDRVLYDTSWIAGGNEIRWDMCHFDVQIIGGIVIFQGKIAEMATGEGKTLVATLPVYLRALAGYGVHVVTVNDYLAKRDSEWMGPIYNFLGLTVDCIDKHKPNSPERRAAYNCDITYGTNSEFGFDYLRDNMTRFPEEMVQRTKHYFSIVDEVDSVLIDDARTPLIISGPIPKKDKLVQNYKRLNKYIASIYGLQKVIFRRCLQEAKAVYKKKDPEQNELDDARAALLMAHLALPKEQDLISFITENQLRNELFELVNLYNNRQKNFSNISFSSSVPLTDRLKQNIINIDDKELYFVVEEDQHSVVFTERGFDFLQHEIAENEEFLKPVVVDEYNGYLTKFREFLDAKADKTDAENEYNSYLEYINGVRERGSMLWSDNVVGPEDFDKKYLKVKEEELKGEYKKKDDKDADKWKYADPKDVVGGPLTLPEIHEGIEQKEKLYSENAKRLHDVDQLIKAYTLFHRNVDYVVIDRKVKIVDEQTGRIMEGRRWSDGLHQAVEAKENVDVEDATQTYATITLQNYFRMYYKLAGMTGTAITEAREFWEIYKLDIVEIPTNKPVVRMDYPDVIFLTKDQKYKAVIRKVQEFREQGRPVLVGTTSVEVSEKLHKDLDKLGIPHNVLNAKLHNKESQVIKNAGLAGTVTIATNMAGRGTDIKLGPGVREAGGLAIIGTEHHDSRRVDRQLRGRAGRQGDPGSSQFYISLEDDLMRRFGSERLTKTMDMFGIKDDEVIENKMVSRQIENAVKRVEENHYGVRKHLIDYDDVMNEQRNAIYKRRRHALFGDRLEIDVDNMIYSYCETLAKRFKDSSFLDYESDEEDVRNRIYQYHKGKFNSYANILKLMASDDENNENLAEDAANLVFSSDSEAGDDLKSIYKEIYEEYGIFNREIFEDYYGNLKMHYYFNLIGNLSFSDFKKDLDYYLLIYRAKNDLGVEFKADRESLKREKLPIIANDLYKAAIELFHERMKVMGNRILAEITINADRYNRKYLAIPFEYDDKKLIVVVDVENMRQDPERELTKAMEKTVILNLIDGSWVDHMREIDDLKEYVQNGAHFEQKDPLVLYKLDSFKLYESMIGKIERDVAFGLMKYKLAGADQPEAEEQQQPAAKTVDGNELKAHRDDLLSQAHSDTQTNQARQPIRVEKKVGRNDPCPCGSGKKYKNCHGRLE